MQKIEQYPATILTGFLGSGKTTLLNRLISNNPHKKFAIIENEIGDINIDSSLIVAEGDGIYELTDGCVCCTLNDELADTLAKLHESDFEFNHLLIETTGIADPNRVAASFFDEYIRELFAIDGTVCLVDARHLERSLDDDETAAKQITFADVILLNKTDLVSESEINRLTQLVKQLNPTAEVVATQNADYRDTNLLHLNAFETYTTEEKLEKIPHEKHSHHGITSRSYIFDEPFDTEYFQYNMTQLADKYQDTIYRIKGIVNFENIDRRVVFQTVRGSGLASTGSLWKRDEKRESKFVFIGKGLPEEIIEQKLRECIYDRDQ